jgi:hypothetical protein
MAESDRQPRWNSLSDAEAFIRAAEEDPSASPYDFGAIPPVVCKITPRGMILEENPEWGGAQYELTFFVDRPADSKIEETSQTSNG